MIFGYWGRRAGSEDIGYFIIVCGLRIDFELFVSDLEAYFCHKYL